VGFKVYAQMHSCGGQCGDPLRKLVLLGRPELNTLRGNAKYSDLLSDDVILLHDKAQTNGTEDSELAANIWVGNVRPLSIQSKFDTQQLSSNCQDIISPVTFSMCIVRFLY
jgi:hypothetical protein